MLEQSTCSFPECPDESKWKGLCKRHYGTMRGRIKRARHAKSIYPDLPGEEWRSVIGCEGFYEVSNEGRVRRCAGCANGGARIGRILTTHITKRGYRYVRLSIAPRTWSTTVHTLVAAAFIGPRPKGMTVNHEDGDKANNHPENFKYMTRADNARHAWETGLCNLRGEGNIHARLTDDEVRAIRSSIGIPRKELARRYGVTPSNISHIINGDTWRHIR